MNLSGLEKKSDTEWVLRRSGEMQVPGILYASEALLRQMDDAVCQQVRNVASLPGIVRAAYAMPDAHWGYGFPIGGVAAFDAGQGGVVSAGGVGFDISCGVRVLLTGLTAGEVQAVSAKLADALAAAVPAGVGSTGDVRLNDREMTGMLAGGARWAIRRGYGTAADLERIENRGCIETADPDRVSEAARRRQRDEMGTLGSGNHYVEVQQVTEVFDRETAERFGVRPGEVAVSIHCGSRGLGHQVATEYSRAMVAAAARHGIRLADRQLACVPLASPEAEAYLGAMRGAINCALANRQILTHLVRRVFESQFPGARLPLLYDVSHNTCSEETHEIDGASRPLHVHRKGATRAFGPGHPDLPEAFRDTGQPVLVGGTMGTASHILAGAREGESRSFSSACHGAGRAMSRKQATQTWRGNEVVADLARRRVLVRGKSYRGIAEEAPNAYKDVDAVVEATHAAGLARRVARLMPMICVKG